MQQSAPSSRKRFPLNQRTVLIGALLGIVLVLGAFFVVHASGSSSPATRHTQKARVKHSTKHACRLHSRRCTVHRKVAHRKVTHRKITHREVTHRKVTHRRPQHHQRHPVTHRRVSSLGVYAKNLVPVLDRTRSAFDGASATVQNGSDPTTTGEACATLDQQLVVLEQQADGVPHPYGSDPRVEQLHYNLLGAFHDMLGALVACNTASDNSDDVALQTAISDIAAADQAMRRLDDYVHSAAGR